VEEMSCCSSLCVRLTRPHCGPHRDFAPKKNSLHRTTIIGEHNNSTQTSWMGRPLMVRTDIRRGFGAVLHLMLIRSDTLWLRRTQLGTPCASFSVKIRHLRPPSHTIEPTEMKTGRLRHPWISMPSLGNGPDRLTPRARRDLPP